MSQDVQVIVSNNVYQVQFPQKGSTILTNTTFQVQFPNQGTIAVTNNPYQVSVQSPSQQFLSVTTTPSPNVQVVSIGIQGPQGPPGPPGPSGPDNANPLYYMRFGGA